MPTDCYCQKIFGFRHTVSSHGASRTCGAQSRGTSTRASAITNTVLKQCEAHGFLIGTLIQGCLACRRCLVHRLSYFLEVFLRSLRADGLFVWSAWCAFCAILRAPRNVICGAWGMLPCEFPYRVQANAASHQDVPAHDAVRRLTHGSQIPFEMQRHTVP